MKKIFLLILLSILPAFTGIAQATFRVMFYNTENFFDTEDDPKKDDADFLPDGSKHWTYGKYKNKTNNIAKVITSVGEWDTPALIGMCEVENDKVMTDLVKYSPLKSQQYEYVITKCADRRGINVALMYQRDRFRYIGHQAYKIKFPQSSQKVTRDVLHVSGQVQSLDTLDVFVCHFPSRRGGEQESEPDRMTAATLVRSKVDSLMKVRKNPNILIMGDFNDEPSNKSIYECLNAKPFSGKWERNKLYNLFYHYEKQEKKGSFKYRNQWNMLDQMIVSGNLMNTKQNFYVLPQTATIFQRDFMMVNDKSNGGNRPKKTYLGMKHEGGYSDHLPVFTDFFVTSQQ